MAYAYESLSKSIVKLRIFGYYMVLIGQASNI